MAKLHFFLLFAFALITSIYAQPLKQRRWSDGPLTWNDFQVKESSNNVRSELKFSMGYHSSKSSVHDTIVKRLLATAYMNSELSWVDPREKTPQLLRYNQVIFDIIEVYRRMLQRSLYFIPNVFEGEPAMRDIFNRCESVLNRFNEESKQGQDLQTILAWEIKAESLLKERPDEPIPAFTFKKWGLGLYGGLGTTFFSGDLGKNTRPGVLFTYGFDVSYKKNMFLFNIGLGGLTSKNDFNLESDFKKGEKLQVAVLEAGWGYIVQDDLHWKVVPYVGIAVNEVSTADVDDKRGWVRYFPVAGVHADYKIREKINLQPSRLNKEMATTSVRLRVFATYMSLPQSKGGPVIGMAVALSGFGKFIGLNQPPVAQVNN